VTTANPPIENDGKCRFCGMYHGPLCPSVRAIEYHPDGTVKRVELVASDYALEQPAHATSVRGPFTVTYTHPLTSSGTLISN
jgi:hypothetical protein